MTDRKKALQDLLAKVEAGEDFPDFSALVKRPLMRIKANEAYRGSLGAAKALHEAVLPGWVFDVTNDSAFVMRNVVDHDEDSNPQFLGEHDEPARAWLIAILKALIAQERET